MIITVDILNWSDAKREASNMIDALDNLERTIEHLAEHVSMGLSPNHQYRQDFDDVLHEEEFLRARLDGILALITKERTKRGW